MSEEQTVTRQEVAELLGVTVWGVEALARRHGWRVVSQGSAGAGVSHRRSYRLRDVLDTVAQRSQDARTAAKRWGRAEAELRRRLEGSE